MFVFVCAKLSVWRYLLYMRAMIGDAGGKTNGVLYGGGCMIFFFIFFG